MCKNHDRVCCSWCIEPSHQQCSNLVNLADIGKANRKITDESLDTLKTKAGILYEHATRLIDHTGEERNNLNKSEEDVKEAVICIKQNFNLLFQTAKEKALNDFASQRSGIEKNIEGHKNEATKFRERIKTSKDHLGVVVKYGTPVYRFLAER